MTAPVRVLFPFIGDSVGGSHRSAALLIRALDPARFEPVVVVHRDGPLAQFLTAAGIAFVRTSVPFYDPGRGRVAAASALALALPRLVRFLHDNRIALVHTNDARMSVTWGPAARIAGCKLVHHQRTKFAPSRLPEIAAGLAQRIVAISNYNKNMLPAGLRERTIVVANPFDTNAPSRDRAASRAALLSELRLPGDTAVVSFVGTLQEQKRPFVFVEAAAQITQVFKRPVAFLMFGRDGEGLAERVRAQATELGIAGQLHWLGFRPDIESAFAASDLVLAPAVNEGSGRVLVEAALAGTAVVAADSGGHREVIANNEDGILVPADDVGALAQAASALLADPGRRTNMAATALTRARARYSVETHAAKVCEVYDAVLGHAPAADAVFVIEGLGGGGAQHVLSTLANRWAAMGRRITVVTLRGEDSDAFALDRSIRRVVTGGGEPSPGIWAGFWANLARLRKLRRALREAGAPVAVGFVGSTNVLLVLAAIGLKLRVVISERNDPARQILPAPWNWLRRIVYPRADVVTANSAAALETLGTFVPRAKLALVPNPLREPSSTVAEVKTAPTLLAVGRLHPQKGFDILIEAFATARRPDWKLVVLGEGAERGALQQQARKLGIEGAVEWKGFVADPFPWYRAADVFVMPSRFEGMPNALLEAMSCGLPAVVSDAVHCEFVADGATALVTPVGDAPALTAALIRLMNDSSLRRKLGDAARASVGAIRPDEAVAAWEKIVFADAA